MRAYKYVGKEYTVVRLDEKSFVGTKIFEGQVIESDRNPAYFLTAGFEEVDVPTAKPASLEDKAPSIEKKPVEVKKTTKKSGGFSSTKKK